MKLFSNTIHSLEKALNYSSTKQKVITQNIANVDTPNYKAKEVTFKDALTDAVNHSMSANRTDSRHFQFTTTQKNQTIKTIVKDISYNHNGNSVDIDKEMASLAENQIYYNAVTERINGKFHTLKTVLAGGK